LWPWRCEDGGLPGREGGSRWGGDPNPRSLDPNPFRCSISRPCTPPPLPPDPHPSPSRVNQPPAHVGGRGGGGSKSSKSLVPILSPREFASIQPDIPPNRYRCTPTKSQRRSSLRKNPLLSSFWYRKNILLSNIQQIHGFPLSFFQRLFRGAAERHRSGGAASWVLRPAQGSWRRLVPDLPGLCQQHVSR